MANHQYFVKFNRENPIETIVGNLRKRGAKIINKHMKIKNNPNIK